MARTVRHVGADQSTCRLDPDDALGDHHGPAARCSLSYQRGWSRCHSQPCACCGARPSSSETQTMSKIPDLEIVRQLLSSIGEDPDREGLRETPARFLKAWAEYTRGYSEKPEDILKVFEDGAQSVDEMVIVRDIPVYSLCEHHLAPFFGKAHIGYVPSRRILGLSKISRLVEVFARRLQVQERLTNQIADALETHLQPLGVAVVIECRHMCMESRGVRHSGTTTVTSALRGSIKNNADTRREFLALIGH